eukprot:gene3442-6838_t
MEPDNENSSNRNVNYWCHSCSGEVLAELNNDTNEFQCTFCEGTFVEQLGQEVETFLEPPLQSQEGNTQTADSDQNRTGATSGELGALLIQRIVNRILGLGVQTRPSVQSTLLTVLQQAALESGRPVGIVVRQSTTARELALLTSVLGMSRGAAATELSSDGIPDIASIFGSPGGMGWAGAPEGRSLEDLLHHLMMNESSHAGAPPASEAAIGSMERQVVSYQIEQRRLGVCCISQEPFEEGEVALIMPCGHSYKEAPIVQWLKRHNTCPVCRYSIDVNDSHANEER